MNQKLSVLLSTAVLVLLFFSVLLTGCVTENKETYVVGITPALQPFSIKSPVTGELEGFDVDMLSWIAEDQGLNFEYKHAMISEFLDGVNDGKYDLMPSVIITDARKEIVAFTDPYLESKYTIVARKDSPLTKDTALNGTATISLVRGSAYVTLMENYFGKERYDELVSAGKILLKDDLDKAVYAVLSGAADVTVCGDIATVAQTKNLPAIQFIGYLDGVIESGIAVAKTDTELLKKLNAGIAHFCASPEYPKLKAKYNLPYQKDTYVVGVDYHNMPFTYLDEAGNLTGFDYESLMWISEKNGFAVKFTEADWSTNINAIIRGDLDMWYSGMTVTKERANRVTFSDPYMSGGVVVLCRAADPVTKDQFESGEVVIGTMLGTTNADWVERHFGKSYNSLLADGKIVLIDGQDDQFAALTGKRIDCIVVDEIGSAFVAKEYNLDQVASFTDGGDISVALQNGDIVLLDMLNSGIAEMKKNGVADQLKAKYDL